MQAVSHDMGTPNVPPIGLGWLLDAVRNNDRALHVRGVTRAAWRFWSSCLEHDLTFAAFGNDPAGDGAP